MKRYNIFEQKITNTICKVIKPDLAYTTNNSLELLEIKKHSNNLIKMFFDCGSLYKTEYGYQKKTEIVFYSPLHNLNVRVECKSHQSLGLLGNVIDELNFIKYYLEDEFWLVLEGALLRPSALKRINEAIVERGLVNKVWVGSSKQLKKKLKIINKNSKN